MLEVGIDTLAVDCDAPDQEALDAGAPSQVHCQVVGGSQLPFAQPGTNQPLKYPSVVVNFNLTKDAAIKLSDLLREKANTLPDERKSSILTANSLHGVDKLAEVNQRFRS